MLTQQVPTITLLKLAQFCLRSRNKTLWNYIFFCLIIHIWRSEPEFLATVTFGDLVISNINCLMWTAPMVGHQLSSVLQLLRPEGTPGTQLFKFCHYWWTVPCFQISVVPSYQFFFRATFAHVAENMLQVLSYFCKFAWHSLAQVPCDLSPFL